MLFERLLHPKKIKGSAFLFGPRMTGKTYLLKSLSADLWLDLLDPEIELSYKQRPQLFWQELSTLASGSLVVVDEIQRVPVLLNYVQKSIEEKNLQFFLSGSSARKLKRGGANLLGGRAKDLRMHPLTTFEIGTYFQIEMACQFGTLPKIVSLFLENEKKEAQRFLMLYYRTYIKEEIQAEALTRNVGAFQRFLQIAAQSNARVIEFANISRECSVPMSTVKEYYSILEDTLLGEFLWPWDRNERKKARPKFYFFDCGVVRAIQNRLVDPPTLDEWGFLFETWSIREIVRIRDYYERAHTLSFYREGNHEIDLIISGGHGHLLAIEIKSGKSDPNISAIRAFQSRFPNIPVVVASLHDQRPRKSESGVEILPFKTVLQRYLEM